MGLDNVEEDNTEFLDDEDEESDLPTGRESDDEAELESDQDEDSYFRIRHKRHYGGYHRCKKCSGHGRWRSCWWSNRCRGLQMITILSNFLIILVLNKGLRDSIVLEFI